jgi:DNA-directed RNA polymerase specialized sigma24 family protein
VTAGELALAFREDSDAKRKAFEECVAAHGPRVLRTAYRLLGSRADAQDAAQEVFLRFFTHQDRLEGDPLAWLYRVTVNVCHDHRRRPATGKDGILHMRGVVVEDMNGVERVRLGAPLPDPMIHGVRQKRSGVISGLLISDAKGNERGGVSVAGF